MVFHDQVYERLSKGTCLALLVGMLTGFCQAADDSTTDVSWPQPAFAGQTKAPAVVSNSHYRAEVIANGLVRPYCLAFLPDGDFIVTERWGFLRVIRPNGEVLPPVQGLPQIMPHEKTDAFFVSGAFFDVALDPKFKKNRLLYLTYRAVTAQTDKYGYPFVFARARLSEDYTRLTHFKVLYQSKPSTEKKPGLGGGRIVFAPDGKIFVTVSAPPDSVNLAQLLDNPSGKVIRLNHDGSIPRDNPFVHQAGALPEIYSYGHRDMQGAALNPYTGVLWETEQGPKGGDEIDIIQAGKNYGWPVITYGREYTGPPVGAGITVKEGMEQPIYYWNPDIASSGMAFYTGDLFPEWKGNLFIGGLVTRDVRRLIVKDDRIVGEESLLAERHQRIREIRQGPDGALYLLTDPRSPSRLTYTKDRSDESFDAGDNAGQLIKVVPDAGQTVH